MCAMSGRYCTVQFRCVQIAENARSSPRAVLIRRAGRLPNLKICPVFGFTSLALIRTVTLATLDSAAAGGTRYRAIG